MSQFFCAILWSLVFVRAKINNFKYIHTVKIHIFAVYYTYVRRPNEAKIDKWADENWAKLPGAGSLKPNKLLSHYLARSQLTLAT